ncbi:uncharacterized protein DS421_15g503770 [Arachis hypogaea]|nr:uncharacterized protein DS421_15g503770 [Arachis hypogaea]
MREESRSSTDALASAVEGVCHPRSIIRVVAVNYFSPALVLLGYYSLLHPSTIIANIDDITAAEGLRYHCCSCYHELGIKGIAVLNPAITTLRYGYFFIVMVVDLVND